MEIKMRMYQWFFLIFSLMMLGGSLMGQSVDGLLPGFSLSPAFNEQVSTFSYTSHIRVHINAACPDSFDTDKPVGLALYALPNGNTIEQTVGKQLVAGDDWHYDIQHIGAQTRFLRQRISDYNLVVVYLETSQKSWPAWKSEHPDHQEIVENLVNYLKSCFKSMDPFIILTGHSGGGRFTFSYLDAVTEIPDDVKRILFLDSNYGYEHTYGDQMIQWLNAAPDHYLTVIAYNDSVALYNGEPIVSPTGGTWYRSRIMQRYMADSFSFTTSENEDFIRHSALDGRLRFILKKNPEKAILHTVQVENDLLRTTHGKGGDDDLAAACHGVLDDIPQCMAALLRGGFISSCTHLSQFVGDMVGSCNQEMPASTSRVANVQIQQGYFLLSGGAAARFYTIFNHWIQRRI